MSDCTLTILAPIWACIVFNLIMTAVNFAMHGHGRASYWYFEKNGGLKIMIAGWTLTAAAMIYGGMTVCG